MDTTLILPAGYSPAMENLLNIARKTRFDFPTEKIILLGGLLNASAVKKELKQLGINIVDIPAVGFVDFLKHLNNDTIVLTSPYGCDHDTLNTLKKEHFRFFETLSKNVKDKLDFINNSKGKYNIIFIGNTNTIEANYISKESKYSFIFYDVNDASKAKAVITEREFNKAKTHILYQTEIAGSSFDSSLDYLKSLLPNAIVEDEMSDENYERKKNLSEQLKDNDVIIFITDTTSHDKYLLEYYHLTTKNLLYAIVKDVKDAMVLKIPSDKRILLVSDGSVPQNIVNDIYNYFTYKSLRETVPDIDKKH